MIKSMTGYGRHETVTDDYKILIEIKSVNHRYCDLNIKLPKKFNEMCIRDRYDTVYIEIAIWIYRETKMLWYTVGSISKHIAESIM